MEAFERSAFVTSAEDLDIHDALMAMQRVLDQRELGRAAREALERAVSALRGGPR